jgi:Ras-related protein Rab-1A
MDTAGQERFKSINTSYYRKADCCLLVYDISNKYSFEQLKDYFIETIKEKCKKNIQIILLGNKTDLEDKRQVSSEEGANLALLNNYIFLETSCLKNENVADAFETLIEITNREAKIAKNGVNQNNISLTN